MTLTSLSIRRQKGFGSVPSERDVHAHTTLDPLYQLKWPVEDLAQSFYGAKLLRHRNLRKKSLDVFFNLFKHADHTGMVTELKYTDYKSDFVADPNAGNKPK
jgi:hypothetical protein